jgi:hypothetical protein
MNSLINVPAKVPSIPPAHEPSIRDLTTLCNRIERPLLVAEAAGLVFASELKSDK